MATPPPPPGLPPPDSATVRPPGAAHEDEELRISLAAEIADLHAFFDKLLEETNLGTVKDQVTTHPDVYEPKIEINEIMNWRIYDPVIMETLIPLQYQQSNEDDEENDSIAKQRMPRQAQEHNEDDDDDGDYLQIRARRVQEAIERHAARALQEPSEYDSGDGSTDDDYDDLPKDKDRVVQSDAAPGDELSQPPLAAPTQTSTVDAHNLRTVNAPSSQPAMPSPTAPPVARGPQPPLERDAAAASCERNEEDNECDSTFSNEEYLVELMLSKLYRMERNNELTREEDLILWCVQQMEAEIETEADLFEQQRRIQILIEEFIDLRDMEVVRPSDDPTRPERRVLRARLYENP